MTFSATIRGKRKFSRYSRLPALVPPPDIFSRSPKSLERARQEMFVGNLYINRGCTGAIVERHPFGGFKMSGGGTKAGSREYLENFLFPRMVAENVIRRGFTQPDEE